MTAAGLDYWDYNTRRTLHYKEDSIHSPSDETLEHSHGSRRERQQVVDNRRTTAVGRPKEKNDGSQIKDL